MSEIKIQFDPDIWASGADDTSLDNPRLGMIPELGKIIVKDMGRIEVRNLIGCPDMSEVHEDIYLLGRGEMQVNFTVLVISYGSDENIIDIFVTRK